MFKTTKYIVDGMNIKNAKIIRNSLYVLNEIIDVSIDIERHELKIKYANSLKVKDLNINVKFLEEITDVKVRNIYI